jgi:hypothetical protein
MTAAGWILFVLGSVGCLYWLFYLYASVMTVKKVPLLSDVRYRELSEWPRLSVIVPACDEAETIEAATRSKLDSGYPNLEIVLIDDRSEDETGKIVDRLAGQDSRIVAVHIDELPGGWLGKLNALHQGVKRATGDYLLFTDADVHFELGALPRAVTYCEESRIGHLAVLPQGYRVGPLVDLACAFFWRMIFAAGTMWKVQEPESKVTAGVGAFNLVRRSAFDNTQGFEWLKMEPADDMALGMMMKNSGAGSAVLSGRGQVGVQLVRSLAEAVRSSEKGIMVHRFSLWRPVVVGIVLLLLEMSPFLAWLPSGSVVPPVIGSVALAAGLASSLLIARFMGNPTLPAVFHSLGALLMIGAMVKSGVSAARRGGLVWRGTFYPKDKLLEAQRLKGVFDRS